VVTLNTQLLSIAKLPVNKDFRPNFVL